jgi:hypothetical protein
VSDKHRNCAQLGNRHVSLKGDHQNCDVFEWSLLVISFTELEQLWQNNQEFRKNFGHLADYIFFYKVSGKDKLLAVENLGSSDTKHYKIQDDYTFKALSVEPESERKKQKKSPPPLPVIVDTMVVDQEPSPSAVLEKYKSLPKEEQDAITIMLLTSVVDSYCDFGNDMLKKIFGTPIVVSRILWYLPICDRSNLLSFIAGCNKNRSTYLLLYCAKFNLNF